MLEFVRRESLEFVDLIDDAEMKAVAYLVYRAVCEHCRYHFAAVAATKDGETPAHNADVECPKCGDSLGPLPRKDKLRGLMTMLAAAAKCPKCRVEDYSNTRGDLECYVDFCPEHCPSVERFLPLRFEVCMEVSSEAEIVGTYTVPKKRGQR